MLGALPGAAYETQNTRYTTKSTLSERVEDFCAPEAATPKEVEAFLHHSEACVFSKMSEYETLAPTTEAMLPRVNEIRESKGLNTLTWHEGAAKVAQYYAIDMMRRAFFSHTSPEGLGVDDRISRLMRTEVLGASGENLARFRDGYPRTYTSTQLQSQLEASPSHYEAMIGPKYTHFGAAIVKHGHEYMAVQIFILPEGELKQDWPAGLSMGARVKLPKFVHGKKVQGWMLTTPDGQEVKRAFNRKVRIPQTEEETLILNVLVKHSNSEFTALYGPAFSVQPMALN